MLSVNEYLNMISALIDDISADFILPEISSIPNPKKRSQLLSFNVQRGPYVRRSFSSNLKHTEFYHQDVQASNRNDDDFRTDKRKDNLPLVPSQFNAFIKNCKRCDGEYEKADISDMPFHPFVMLITDTLLDKENTAYLQLILSSIKINLDSQADVYKTLLIKCHGIEKNEICAQNCFCNLKEEIKLVSPYSILCFGPLIASSFLDNGYTTGVYEGSIPYITVPKFPLEIKNDNNEKNRLWEKLKVLKRYFLSL